MQQWKEKTPFQQEETFGRTRLRKGGHLPRLAGGYEDGKEGTANNPTPGQGFLLGKRNTS